MATLPIADASVTSTAESQVAQTNASRVLICLPSITSDNLQIVREHVTAAMPGTPVVMATSGATSSTSNSNMMMVDLPVTGNLDAGWVLTADDYHRASELALEHGAAATLLIGAEATSLSTAGIQALITTVIRGEADLAVARYKTGPQDALVSSALLYPLTYALFGAQTHLPLPVDIAFSARMAKRLSVAARKPDASAGSEPLLWPVAEAAVASFTVREIDAGERTLPHPTDTDLNSLLAQVVGSLFGDIELKANFWQRARVSGPAHISADPKRGNTADVMEDVREMAESFRNAYANLQEIWSLVLPPQTLLGLKRASRAAPEDFEIPSNLWARTIYDFVLAYHLRTINRGHLLGSLTPLYLAWVASHLRRAADASTASAHVEETAAAFIAEKPYIVSRWRWPDRFNP